VERSTARPVSALQNKTNDNIHFTAREFSLDIVKSQNHNNDKTQLPKNFRAKSVFYISSVSKNEKSIRKYNMWNI
jgi:hypothetical protein